MTLNEIAKVVKYATVVNQFIPTSYQFYPVTHNLWIRIEKESEVVQWLFCTSEPLNQEYYRRFEEYCLNIIKEN